MEQILAPWSDEQVKKLHQYQDSGTMHPFTCPLCSRENRHGKFLGNDERDGRAIYDHVNLIPTTEGWVCASDGYTQQWAYDFMFY